MKAAKAEAMKLYEAKEEATEQEEKDALGKAFVASYQKLSQRYYAALPCLRSFGSLAARSVPLASLSAPYLLLRFALADVRLEQCLGAPLGAPERCSASAGGAPLLGVHWGVPLEVLQRAALEVCSVCHGFSSAMGKVLGPDLRKEHSVRSAFISARLNRAVSPLAQCISQRLTLHFLTPRGPPEAFGNVETSLFNLGAPSPSCNDFCSLWKMEARNLYVASPIKSIFDDREHDRELKDRISSCKAHLSSLHLPHLMNFTGKVLDLRFPGFKRLPPRVPGGEDRGANSDDSID